MSRYTWSRLLFLILGLVAAALTLVPLTQDAPSLTACLLALPVVVLLMRLKTHLTQRTELRDYVGASLGVEIRVFPADVEQIALKAAPFGSIK